MYRRQNRRHRKGLSLRNEILGRKLQHRINICLAGSLDSGKSTLATRFRDIEQGPYPDLFFINKLNKYIISIELDSRPNVRKRGEVILNIYIEPPPNRRLWYPLWISAPLVSLVVFCFDVNDEDTFYETAQRIFLYNLFLRENIPDSIVLGNKIDVRDDPWRVRSKNVVRTGFARRETSEWQVSDYFECSAWENIGVNRLLDYILNSIL